MTSKFRKAVPKREFFKWGCYGKTGSGKTLTSLLIAEELARLEGKRIAYIDTEKSTAFYIREVEERKVHPAPFDIDILETKSMFEALEAVESINPEEHGVVIVDSITALWNAAKGAYAGRLTSKGGIPINAWGPIKRPYLKLIALGMDGPFHFGLCGREGVELRDTDDGDLEVVGHKMKAEGETPYEPHVLIRMIPERLEDGSHKIRAFFEKDRSGVLEGRTIDWPSFDTVARSVAILSGVEDSGKLGTPDDVAARDAALAEARQDAEEAERVALYESIAKSIKDATDLPALKAAWSLTKGKKGKLGEDNMEKLEAAKNARKVELIGGVE